MSTSIQTRHMIDRIENEAFLSTPVKKALCTLYENQIKGPDQQQDEQQYKRDHQIQDLYYQLKTNLNNWKNKWLKLVIDVQQFEKAFGELVDYLESSFSIISTIFEHISKKTNDVEKENEELRKNLQKIKYETEELKTRLNQIEISEKRRVEKEKILEKRILIRDLFLMAHKKIHEEKKKRALPKNILSIVSNNHPPANNPKVFRVGDKVLVLLNDANLYPARLIRFGLKNEWMIEFDDKTQAKQWVSPNRLWVW
ncbi:unnamed protein product, partial [Rotaria sp. Silwood1]